MSTPLRARVRNKLGLVTVLALSWAAIMGVMWVGQRHLILPDYARIERQAAIDQIDRVKGAMDSGREAYSRVVRDWATWDDAWAFARGERPEFVEDECGDDAIRTLGADLMVILDANGRPLLERLAEPGVPALRTELPAPLRDALLSNTGIAAPSDAGAAGIVLTPSGPFEVAAQQITRSGRLGPVGGVLMLGRRLDPPAVATFGRRLRVAFSLAPIAGPHPGVGDPPSLTVSPDGRSLVVQRVDVDPQGEPVMILTATVPRTIYLEGERLTAMMLRAAGVAVGLVLAAVGVLYGRVHRAALEKREADALYNILAGRSSDGVLLVDDDGLVRHFSGAVPSLLGLAAGEPLVGVRLTELWGEDVRPGVPETGDAPAILHRDGPRGVSDLEVASSRVQMQGEVLRCLTVRDVTERVRDEARMRHLAFHDALTGLPNRLLFQDRLAQALVAAERTGTTLAVAFVDLDHFKGVNDALGHDHADELLIEISRRIVATTRPGDTAARQGGDEFLLLLAGVRDAGDARVVCERLLENIRRPVHVDGRDFSLSASIGVALYPADGRDATSLVKSADLAMYKAKQSGRDVWQLVDTSLHQRLARIVDLRARLMRAVEQDELVLHYQPQVDAQTGRIVAFEALVRWQPPGEALVSPGVFIPVAEETGLIAPIGEWVIREACRQLRAWRDEGRQVVRVAVNVSALQFQNGGLTRLIQESLTRSELDASLLEVELTESIAMGNPEAVRAVLSELVASGVGVALDDFGTGHSSLAALRSLPLHRLKIDRGFLRQIDDDGADQAVVGAIISLAHALRLEVVAEGVERSAQRDVLTRMGCDLLQGFGLYRPAPAADASVLLAGTPDRRPRLVQR